MSKGNNIIIDISEYIYIITVSDFTTRVQKVMGKQENSTMEHHHPDHHHLFWSSKQVQNVFETMER